MAKAVHVYADHWGQIIDWPDAGFIEIRWFDTTRDMTKADFNAWLATFAGYEEKLRRRGVLIDGTSFLMDPANSDGEWREINIIPRYNAAGVKRFAFQFPAGMPLIGAPPAIEGAASYPTGYFGSRQDVLDWLGGA